MNGTPTILGVLLIDDNAEWARQVRQRIERSLPESNRCVRWESSLAAGKKALAEFHADVTILDLSLPDSPDPQQTLQAIPAFLPPVFVMSNHFLEDNPWHDQLAMDCLKAGAFRVYAKDEITVSWVVREIVQTHVRNVLHGSRN